VSLPRSGAIAALLAVIALTLGGCARKAAVAANPERGRVAYAKYCATCHGAQGNGYVADNAPSLRTATFLATATDAFLREGIGRGRPGTAMAAYNRLYGGPLNPDDIDAIIAFLRVGGPPALTLAPRPVTGDAKAGKEIYDSLCMRCHGTPTQRSSAVHLANPVLLMTATDAFLRYAVESGRPPTSMVPWKETLNPKQLDDVLTYVRFLATPPPPPPLARLNGPPAPRPGPIVLNPKGRAPEFALKEDRYVSIDDVKRALDEKRRLIIADARAPSDYASLHIAGAISTPYYDAVSLDDIPNDGTWVLAYCACPHHVSGQVVDELRKRGYKHTAVIDEGVFAWQQKHYPVVAVANLPPIPAPPPPRPDVIPPAPPGTKLPPAQHAALVAHPPPPVPTPPSPKR
jgi:cytochrome c oxidase cbb3-type subunit 3/ubiquinol-cytochrome c reductase cytochrome c subunit